MAGRWNITNDLGFVVIRFDAPRLDIDNDNRMFLAPREAFDLAGQLSTHALSEPAFSLCDRSHSSRRTSIAA
jgi:hypothetical protein